THATPTLRRNHPETTTLLTAAAQAHVHGTTLNTDTLYPNSVRRVDLPTYAFQRQSYWLDATTVGDVGAAGLDNADHPLLAPATQLPDRGYLVTGKLSRQTHPWLADHAVAGTVILPGTAFVDLALHTGHYAGCNHIQELILHTPLVLPESGAVHIHVRMD